MSTSSTVPAGVEAAAAPAPVAAAASSSPPAPGTASSAGTKACSGCSRQLHASAFSGTQAKAPAKARKCMECVVKAAASAAAPIAAQQRQQQQQPSTTAAGSTTSSTTSSDAKKGKKRTTPGAVARERAAERAALERKSYTSSAQNQGIVVKKGQQQVHPRSLIHAARKNAGHSAGLLDANDEWFVPKAEAALVDIFRRFDSTHAGSSAEEVKRDALCWTVDDIQRFAQTTNGRPFSSDELSEITDNLTHDKDGRLTLQGFLDFFHLQTTSHPDETWKDLTKLGYNRQLERTQQ